MKTYRVAYLFLSFVLVAFLTTAQERYIKGVVTHEGIPLEDVNVKVMGKKMSTVTDKDGKYQILADTGDNLRFSYTGKKTLNIFVEDVTTTLNISMFPEFTQLEEVTVEKENRTSQEYLRANYLIDNKIVRTAFGYLNTRTSASSSWVYDSDDSDVTYFCLVDLLRSRFPNLQTVGNCASGGIVFLRGFNSIGNVQPILFDVDGLLMTEIPIEISGVDVQRVAVLRDLSSRILYGSRGAGGVIVINLKRAVFYPDKQNETIDITSKEPILTQDQLERNAPTYLKELRGSASLNDAKLSYEKNLAMYANSPYFLLDAYQYFHDEGNDVAFADSIITDNFQVFQWNPVLLKALGYIYDDQGRADKAHEIAKEVFVLRPNYVQSYIDVARSYRNIGNNRQSAIIYSRYYHLLDQGFIEEDSVTFGPLVRKEFGNLVSLEKGLNDVVDRNRVPKSESGYGRDVRLVFEWNDSEAEFELEMLKSNEQRYTWNHTMKESEDDIQREKEYGYSMVDYMLDGTKNGVWKVNVKYLGNKSLTPTYLKTTVYYNYGTKSQFKEVNLFKLDIKDLKQELLQIPISNSLVVR